MKKYFKEGFGFYGDEICTAVQENADGEHTDVYKAIGYGKPDYSEYYIFEITFTNIEHMLCDLFDVEDYINNDLALTILSGAIQGYKPNEDDIRIGYITTHYEIKRILTLKK